MADLKNSETMHFRAYVDINYVYFLHMGNCFLKLRRVYLKHPVFCVNLKAFNTNDAAPIFCSKPHRQTLKESVNNHFFEE
jgi:hypothetical protein